VAPLPPEAFTRFIQDEVRKWRAVAQAGNVRID
jgi:hypothetical protein